MNEKIKTSIVGCFVLLSSCSSNQKEFSTVVEELQQINDRVAFENKCKLTTTYTDMDKHKLALKIGSPYSGSLVPGKILFDYYQLAIRREKIDITKYTLYDLNNDEIYSLSKDDIEHINYRVNETKFSLEEDYSNLYNQLDTSITNYVKADEFNQKMSKFDPNDVRFSGFQLVDSMLGIGFKNSIDEIVFIYKWRSQENKLYGISIE